MYVGWLFKFRSKEAGKNKKETSPEEKQGNQKNQLVV